MFNPKGVLEFSPDYKDTLLVSVGNESMFYSNISIRGRGKPVIGSHCCINSGVIFLNDFNLHIPIVRKNRLNSGRRVFINHIFVYLYFFKFGSTRIWGYIFSYLSKIKNDRVYLKTLTRDYFDSFVADNQKISKVYNIDLIKEYYN